MDPTSTLFNLLKGIKDDVRVKYAQGSNDYGVKEKSFILGDRESESSNPSMGTPNDFPRLTLEAKPQTNGQGAPKTFGMGHTSVDHVVPITCSFMITVVYQNTTWDQQVDIEAAIDRFLESLRYTIFGLSNLQANSYTWSNSRVKAERNSGTANQPRTVTRRTVVVNCRPYRSQLLL